MHKIAKQTRIFDSASKILLPFLRLNIDKIIINIAKNCKRDENLKAFIDKPKIIIASPAPDNWLVSHSFCIKKLPLISDKLGTVR